MNGKETAATLSRGYTLIEMLVILSVIAFLSAAGISHINRSREQLGLRFAAQAFSEELNRARAASIACGMPVEISISSDTRSGSARFKHTGAEFGRVELPGGFRFTGQPSKPMVFYGTGTCAPSGTFVISSGRGVSVKVVVSIMGRVRWAFS